MKASTAMFQIVPRSAEIRPQWDALVRSSPDGWAWGLYDWQDVALSYERLGLQDRGFALSAPAGFVAVMPLHLISAERRLASSGFGVAGPMLVPGLSERHRRKVLTAIFDAVIDIARDEKCVAIDVGSSPVCTSSLESQWGVNPFVEFGFRDVSEVTRVIDLRDDTQTLFSALSDDAKQKIKRAESLGYRVSRASWPNMLDDYYRIHRETYYRTGAVPHDRFYFEGIANKMEANRSAQLWAGFGPDGRPVAFHNDARFNHASYYHTGCSETASLDSGVNSLLFWHAILGAKEDGCSWYEIGHVFPGVANGKLRGLTVFKSKFGGKAHRHFLGRLDIESAIETAPVQQLGVRASIRQWLMASRDLVRAVVGS